GQNETTRKFGGLGLGLAISRRIAELHSGTLAAYSEGRGKGTRMVVELPTVSVLVPKVAEEPAPEPAKPVEKPLHILLVEDNESTLMILQKLLVALGHTVKAAGTAEAALEAAQKEDFDLIISDLGLPDRSGYELMGILRDRYGLKGVALSGYGMEEDVRKSREAGFAEHLVKPVDLHVLEAVVERAAHAKG
ncbi:MAG TPA: response regulator, partial [Tepidisphaeraceae bacterium]|nr:response regulator [Tepidisphaeraceae bacterium]